MLPLLLLLLSLLLRLLPLLGKQRCLQREMPNIPHLLLVLPPPLRLLLCGVTGGLIFLAFVVPVIILLCLKVIENAIGRLWLLTLLLSAMVKRDHREKIALSDVNHIASDVKRIYITV